jgi:hypothetical protein
MFGIIFDFDALDSILTNASSVMLRPNNLETRHVMTVKTRKETKQCREMKPNSLKDRAMHEGDVASFFKEFMKINYFLPEKFIFVSLQGCRDPWGLINNLIKQKFIFKNLLRLRSYWFAKMLQKSVLFLIDLSTGMLYFK